MSLNETALACLNRNRLLYLNMLEVLRRGLGGAALGRGGRGAALDRGRGPTCLPPGTGPPLDGMLPLPPADCDLLVGHDLWYRDELAGRFGLWEGGAVCPGRLDGSWSRRRRRLSAGAAPFGGVRAPYVCEHYSKSDIGGLEHIRQAIGAGMLGPRGRDAGGLRGLPARAPSAFWRCRPPTAAGAWGSAARGRCGWRWSGGSMPLARCLSTTPPPWPSRKRWA